MNIALVHDHLISDGGGERVLKAFSEVWPDAPIFTLLYDPHKTHGEFGKKNIYTSYLQSLPLGIKKFRWFLPLRPKAIESIDLANYDVVLSNSSALIKGVITSPHTLHINYCHTPTRFLWIDPTQRYDSLERIWPISYFSDQYKEKYLKEWDKRAASRINVFIANSYNAQRGIKKYYNRTAEVIFPPVAMQEFSISPTVRDYFVAGGRLAVQKRYELIIQAFNKLMIPLKIFGMGPEYSRLKKIAHSHIEFLGRISDQKKAILLSRARAFLYPQVEDLGITAIESMAVGRPVIAYRAGGALDTVVEGETGIFFDNQDWESLADVVIRFYDLCFDPYRIRQYAEQFSENLFKQRIKSFVEREWERFSGRN